LPYSDETHGNTIIAMANTHTSIVTPPSLLPLLPPSLLPPPPAELAVDAVLRLKGSNNLEHIQIIKKPGGALKDSFLADGFLLDKKIGVGQPKRLEKATILVANTSMDTDKIKIFGSRVRVDSMAKVREGWWWW